MSSSTSTRALVLISLVILIYGCSSVSSMMLFKKHVYVKNHILPDVTMKLHCASRDDDLGVHIIPYGNDWSWTFHPKLFSTLFWCNLEWVMPSTKQLMTVHFDAYDAGHPLEDVNDCDNCVWWAYADGLYHQSRGDKPIKLKHQWVHGN
ncbi:Plant self-incompatibility s1 [Thalictrum thalictroides]|uniref:S-protein homolog n=1 Tax=Thalictrum thalictroides TaxID=46969 RepID=A0A7J6WN52_THATH|nr:Plant self-incompatibility s1 [Thalictrum thalictroides]